MAQYTQQDINTIKDCISRYPTNLNTAFEEASRLIDRKASAVSQYYYSKLKHQEPIHSLATSNGYVVNVKNSPTSKDDSHELRLSLVKDIINKMSKTEKQQVLSIILKL